MKTEDQIFERLKFLLNEDRKHKETRGQHQEAEDLIVGQIQALQFTLGIYDDPEEGSIASKKAQIRFKQLLEDVYHDADFKVADRREETQEQH